MLIRFKAQGSRLKAHQKLVQGSGLRAQGSPQPTAQNPEPFKPPASSLQPGFTLVELIIGAAMVAIAITALLGAFLGQVTLNEHARNLTWAINDANRIMEQLRLRNTNTPTACAGESGGGGNEPTAAPPTGFTSWNAWLADTSASGGGGKSIQPNPAVDELIVVTCQNNAVGNAYCGTVGSPGQIGTQDWLNQHPTLDNTAYDPIRVTVAVCWRHRGRVLGQCTWNDTNLVPDDTVSPNTTTGVIDSPAMLSTVITCRR